MFSKSELAETMMLKLKNFRTDIDYIKAATDDDEVQVNEVEVADLIQEVEDKYSLVEGRYIELLKADEDRLPYVKSLVDHAWRDATYTIDRIRAQLFH